MNDTTLGIILKQSEYKNNDALIKVLTKEYGKLSIVVKGIRKATSKNSSSCMPFCTSEFIFDYKYNQSIYNLKKSSIVTNNFKIYDSLEKLSACNVIAQIIDTTLPDMHKDSELFEICDYLLKKVNLNVDIYMCICLILVKILKINGIVPNVKCCINCGNEVISSLSLQGGGFVCKGCQKDFYFESLAVNRLKKFRYLVMAEYKDYDTLFELFTCDLSDCDLFMNFLKLHSGTNIKSYEFFKNSVM